MLWGETILQALYAFENPVCLQSYCEKSGTEDGLHGYARQTTEEDGGESH